MLYHQVDPLGVSRFFVIMSRIMYNIYNTFNCTTEKKRTQNFLSTFMILIDIQP